MTDIHGVEDGNGDDDGGGCDDRVKRFLNRTLSSLAEQKRQHLLRRRYHDAMLTSTPDESASQFQSHLPSQRYQGAHQTVSERVRHEVLAADGEVPGQVPCDDDGDGDGDGDGIDEGKTNGSNATLLNLPVEIRQSILKLVLWEWTFLSSRQQVTASPDLSFTSTSSPTNESLTLNNNNNNIHNHEVEDDDYVPVMKPDKNPSRRQRSKPAQSSTRFTQPSYLLKGYRESRQADTAVLYTCRQLRQEGYHLWYATRYYLTMVIEQGRRQQHHLDSREDDTSTITAHDGTTTSLPALIRHDNRTLRFDENNQELFWRQIARDLHFPTLKQVNMFKTFHVSLFIEESAFKGIDQWSGVNGGGLPSAKIVQILMGENEDNNNNNNDTLEQISSDQTDTASTGENGVDTARIDQLQQLNPDQEQIRFLDHTYLRLACDAVDDADPKTQSLPFDYGFNRPIPKLTFSIEMWRV